MTIKEAQATTIAMAPNNHDAKQISNKRNLNATNLLTSH
jgi:hypothetical protein